MNEGSEQPPMSGIRLLVVADDETRAALRSGLYPRFQIIEASSATEALSLVRARWFNAIVADYELGESSGLELLKQLNTEFPRINRILISRRSVPNLRDMLDEGVVELFLAKPVDPAEFSGFFRST